MAAGLYGRIDELQRAIEAWQEKKRQADEAGAEVVRLAESLRSDANSFQMNMLRFFQGASHEPEVEPKRSPVRPTTPTGQFAPKGDIPLQQAILQALQEARGKGMTVEAIYQRALELGARSGSGRPLMVVSQTAKNLRSRHNHPIERDGATGEWRWAGPIGDDAGTPRLPQTNGGAVQTEMSTDLPDYHHHEPTDRQW